MGKHFHGNMEKIGVAALLHDCGREIPTRDSLMYAMTHQIPMDFVEEHQPILLHAKLGGILPGISMGLPIRKSWTPSPSIPPGRPI
jgi:HD superfamily phosphohydrolase YqeK